MSDIESTPKITAVKKEKDPRRVEAGRRLAQISKESKEKKMGEKVDRECGLSFGHIIGVIGVTAAIGALYYARKSDLREEKPQPVSITIYEKEPAAATLDSL